MRKRNLSDLKISVAIAMVISSSTILPLIIHEPSVHADVPVIVKKRLINVVDTGKVKVDTTKIALKITVQQSEFEYKVDKAGETFIKEKEGGFQAQVYHLFKEKSNTIGYGHYIKKGEKIPSAITKEYGEKLFRSDMNEINAGINRYLKSVNKKVKFSQGFINGLGDLMYNVGPNGVNGTEFDRRLRACRVKNGQINKDDLKYTIAAIKKTHVYCNAHKNRRYDTQLMMLD